MMAKTTIKFDNVQAQEFIGSFCLGNPTVKGLTKTEINRWTKPIMKQHGKVVTITVPFVDFQPMINHLNQYRHQNCENYTVFGLKELNKMIRMLNKVAMHHIHLMEQLSHYIMMFGGLQNMRGFTNQDLVKDYQDIKQSKKFSYSPVDTYSLARMRTTIGDNIYMAISKADNQSEGFDSIPSYASQKYCKYYI